MRATNWRLRINSHRACYGFMHMLCALCPQANGHGTVVVDALGASQARPAIDAPANRNGNACALIRRYTRALISACSRYLKDAPV